MSDLLITLMNSPRQLQRAVAFGLLGVLAALLLWLALLATSVLQDKAQDIESMRETLYSLNQVNARRPQLQAQQQLEGLALFMEGDSVAAIQAKLQERLSTVSAASGAVISSVAGVPQLTLDDVNYVGLKADIEGSLEAVHEMFRQLELSLPPLVVRQAHFHGMSEAGEAASQPVQVSVQLTVLAPVDPALAAVPKVRPDA